MVTSRNGLCCLCGCFSSKMTTKFRDVCNFNTIMQMFLPFFWRVCCNGLVVMKLNYFSLFYIHAILSKLLNVYNGNRYMIAEGLFGPGLDACV